MTYLTFLDSNNSAQGALLGVSGVMGMTVDDAGNVYLTGITDCADFPILNPLPGQPTVTTSNPRSAFVAKINQAGDLLFSTYLGGNDGQSSTARAIKVDSSGNIYVAGGTNSRSFPVTSNALRNVKTDDADDVFLTKLDSTGSQILYSTYFSRENLQPLLRARRGCERPRLPRRRNQLRGSPGHKQRLPGHPQCSQRAAILWTGRFRRGARHRSRHGDGRVPRRG